MVSEARSIRSSPTRSSRSCHDSANPCRAWARSPTMVKLRDGQRSSSICHSASVSSWASSTTMCANGPASRSGSAPGSAASSTRASLQVLRRAASTSRCISESSVAIRWSTTWAISLALGGERRPRCRRLRRDASGSPSRCRAASRSGRSETVQACGVARAAAAATSSGSSQGAHRRRYAGTDHRSPTRSVGSISGQARSKASTQLVVLRAATRRSRSGRDLVAVVLVDQDREQLLPDLVARLVVRRARVRATRTPRPSRRRSSQTSAHGVSTSMPSVGGSS